jgi:hypothetical protein
LLERFKTAGQAATQVIMNKNALIPLPNMESLQTTSWILTASHGSPAHLLPVDR